MAKQASFLLLVLLFVGFLVALHNTARVSKDTYAGFFESKNSLRRRAKRPFHVVVTSTPSIYENWQCRVAYYWYKRFKDRPGSETGGFTRILSGDPDALMNEIPTFLVEPLPVSLTKGYIVLNRPWALVQWLERANITEDYIFMSEPDHIIARPLPNLASSRPAAFPFRYITPGQHAKVIRKYYSGPVSSIDPIGNSPATIVTLLISFLQSDLRKIAPTWYKLAVAMKQDPEADGAFGWVLEMFAYAVASAIQGIRHDLHREFMIQPPFDQRLRDEFLIHYTYGCSLGPEGAVVTHGAAAAQWSFDKRFYIEHAPPMNLSLPPPKAPQSIAMLVSMLNEATADIPDWG